MQPKVLAIVAVDKDVADIASSLSDLKAQLLKLTGAEFTVVDSASWYRKSFDRCGAWDAWVWDAVSGQDYTTRKPHFTCFVVCESTLGKASAGIVDLALRNGRKVFFWQAQGKPLLLVTKVEEQEQNLGAWSFRTTPIGD